MIEPSIHYRLSGLFQKAPVLPLSESDRYVIVSDLHMGDGSSHDDFKRTSTLFSNVFERFYFDRGFKIILNGDVEDLHKFLLDRVISKWAHIYDLFRRFQEEITLFRLHGNHDPFFYFPTGHNIFSKQFEALRMRFRDSDLFFLHGHQASNWLERLHHLNAVMFKTIINPLRINGLGLDLGKKGITIKEERLNEFSMVHRIMTFMGHTHRPLFGSDSGVPHLYNSGAAVGRKGITTLEIDRGNLNLVHWWGRKLVKRYLDIDRYEPERLGGKDIYRVVLNSRPLSQVLRCQGVPS
ncbi:MAG: metallophosphoesterase [Thermoplasmatota archaeon]